MIDQLGYYFTTTAGVIRAVTAVASVGVLVSTFEWASLAREFGDRGIFAWKVASVRYQRSRRVVRWAMAALAGRLVEVMAVRALAALWCLVAPSYYPAVPLTVLVLTHAYLHLRCRYGLEGSDQMLLLVTVVLWVDALAADERVSSIAVAFLAAQSALAYFAAGAAKLFGRTWRTGTAVREIFRTRSFGHPSIARFLTRRPFVGKAATYLILAFECGFPLVFALPPPYSGLWLLAAAVFHGVNAVVMGLNIFVWAFLATYPPVFFCSRVVSGWLWE